METAAKFVRTARRWRLLTQKELAGISGVSPSTLSRLESGKIDPAYSTVIRLLPTMGYKPGPDLDEESDDSQILAAILAINSTPGDTPPLIDQRFDVYRVAGQVSPVTARVGARTVTADLNEMVDVLEGAGVPYAFSALEGFYGGWPKSGPGSFWPVVYIDPEFVQPWPTQPVPGTRGTVYTLPMTENASRFAGRVNGISAMRPDWSIIDTIASSLRQSDVGLELLEALDSADRKKTAAGNPDGYEHD